MDPELLKEVYHWVPTPILGALVTWFFSRWLRGHEEKLQALVVRLETASTVITAHHSALERLKERVDELWELRKEVQALRLELARFKSYMAGSGPKPHPLIRQPLGEDDE